CLAALISVACSMTNRVRSSAVAALQADTSAAWVSMVAVSVGIDSTSRVFGSVMESLRPGLSQTYRRSTGEQSCSASIALSTHLRDDDVLLGDVVARVLASALFAAFTFTPTSKYETVSYLSRCL